MKKYCIVLILILCPWLNYSVLAQNYTSVYPYVELSWHDFSKRNLSNTPYKAKIAVNHQLEASYTLKDATLEIKITSRLLVDKAKSEADKSFLAKATKEEQAMLLDHEKGHLVIINSKRL